MRMHYDHYLRVMLNSSGPCWSCGLIFVDMEYRISFFGAECRQLFAMGVVFVGVLHDPSVVVCPSCSKVSLERTQCLL